MIQDKDFELGEASSYEFSLCMDIIFERAQTKLRMKVWASIHIKIDAVNGFSAI